MFDPLAPVGDHRPPISPALALRVAVLGGVALVMFAIIFFRLWYLQVLSGDQYVKQANSNRVRALPIAAPRGEIVDRNGSAIVTDRLTQAVQVVPDELPPAGPARLALYRRLGVVLRMSPREIGRLVASQHRLVPYANVTVSTDPGRDVLNYLAERQRSFPGVTQQPLFLREYPNHSLASQLLGQVGEISPEELKSPRLRGVAPGTVVGKSGLERSYDHYLRGRPGRTRVQVDATGLRTATALPSTTPRPGHELKLSLDLGLQKEGQRALAQGIELAHRNGHSAPAGAFVALDPSNGQVLAMGSEPGFDPNVFAKPIPQERFQRLFGERNGGPGPLYDRAVSGGYPTGSTFKPITALASLENGLITPDSSIAGGACLLVGAAHQKFCNAGNADFGTISLRDALRVSSDVFFYTLGQQANARGDVIQSWARKFGLGRPTGIDIAGEYEGVIPDRAWRAHVNQQEKDCERERHKRSCAISDGRPWTVGDNVNLAVGQGDLQATPLQMAVAYSGLVEGGRVPRPHLALQVDDTQGRLIQRIDTPPARRISFSPAYQQAIMDGLHAATSQPGGTSYDVFRGFPRTVFGKTGTAQHTNQEDQAWFVCYSPGPRPIVVAVTIEKGGFGAEVAAPVARLILSQWFGLPKKLVAGTSKTR